MKKYIFKALKQLRREVAKCIDVAGEYIEKRYCV